MAYNMPKSPLASLAVGRRAVSPLHWLLLLLLLGALSVVQARAGPEANPKSKAQSEVENYQDYSEYGEDVYGKGSFINDVTVLGGGGQGFRDNCT